VQNRSCTRSCNFSKLAAFFATARQLADGKALPIENKPEDLPFFIMLSGIKATV